MATALTPEANTLPTSLLPLLSLLEPIATAFFADTRVK